MPTDPNRPLKVFLRHVSADKLAVRDLYKRLIANGVDAWLDTESLIPGQNWQVRIPNAIRESDVVIVCLSEKSINKEGYVQKEIKFALDVADEKPEGTIFIIPVRLEECKTPDRLSMYHWVDYFEKDGYEKLIRALQIRAKSTGVSLHETTNWSENVLSLYSADGYDEKKPSVPLKGKSQRSTTPRKPSTAIVVAMIGLFGTICAALINSPMIANFFSRTPESTATPVFTPTEIAPLIPSETPSKIFTPTATAIPEEIIDPKGVIMHLVPAGEFTMGDTVEQALGECQIYSNSCERWWFTDLGPPHRVYLDDFYMDAYEVTNMLYKACVNAGSCIPLQDTSRYDDPNYENHPVVYVDWNQAKTYCEWRSASLPTEAQWEKAARGTDGRTYPWGNTFDGAMLNFCDKNCSSDFADKFDDGYADTAPVGSYEGGKSPYNIYDLAGNVWEWIADWYDPNYYANSSTLNPLGPNSGDSHVLRGGAWFSSKDFLLTAIRYGNTPDYFSNLVGFRCVRSLP